VTRSSFYQFNLVAASIAVHKRDGLIAGLA